MNLLQKIFILCLFEALHQVASSKKEKACPPLPYISLPHGEILVTSSSTIRFQCDKDYFWAGPVQIRCWNGMWTSIRRPLCLKKEGLCNPPQEVPNANIVGNDMNIGSRVLYNCHPGYTLIGESIRQCLESGGWSGITPACISETESMQEVASRLDETFIKALTPKGPESIVRGRYLDTESLFKGLELVILVDRSSSVGEVDLNKGKDFIKFLFQKFKIKNTNNDEVGARAAVVAFGTKVDIIFNLDDERITSPEIANKILDEKLQPGGGGTAMVPALIDVYVKVEPLLRKDAKRAIFLLSDGDPNVGGSNADAVAGNLKEDAHFEIFAVGIGRAINRHLLSRIASEPVIDHVFLLENYDNLKEVLAIIKNQPVEEAPPPRPPADQCGLPTEAIYFDNRSWNAVIYVSHYVAAENVTKLRICGGALICSQWVLTAASCFYYVDKETVILQLQEVFVVLGEMHLLELDPKQNNFYAEDIVIHPEFDPKNDLYNNVALIELNQPAPEINFRPVCLPNTDIIIPLYLNTAVNKTLKGWGSFVSKQEMEDITPTSVRSEPRLKQVRMGEDNECKRSVGKKIQGKSIFCASSGTDLCLGNIGTPVVGKNPKTGLHQILGVLSQRRHCSKGFSPYTELTKFIPWINKESGKCHFKHWKET